LLWPPHRACVPAYTLASTRVIGPPPASAAPLQEADLCPRAGELRPFYIPRLTFRFGRVDDGVMEFIRREEVAATLAGGR
jgi:hypothetical protein